VTSARRPGQARVRYAFLIGCALFLGAINLAMFYGAELLASRDFSAIPNANVRVAYCISVSATASEKRLIADTVSRPPQEELFATIMPYAVVGEVTAAKTAAMKALKQRVDWRGRANEHALRLAAECHYEGVGWRHGETPLNVAEKWLRADPQFADFLTAARRTEPDAARTLYDQLRSTPQPGAAPTL
jgi:hypothetical protein